MKKTWRILLKTTGGIVTLLIIFCVCHRAYWQTKFNRQVAELKAEGVPISFEDLDKMDMLPQGVPNAADVYLQAFEHYQEPDESLIHYLPNQGDYEIPEDKLQLPDEVIDAIAATLEANKQTLELLDQGATIMDCVFPRERPLDMNNQELFINVKNCGELLCERNLFLAQTNQNDKLRTSLPTLLHFSKGLIRRGTLIDEMIAAALKSKAADNIEYIIYHVEFTDSQLANLQKEYHDIQDLEACYRGFIKERIFYFENILTPFEERIEETSISNRRRESIYSMVGLMQKEHVMHLNYFQRFIVTSQLPLEEHPYEFNTIISELLDDVSFWQLYMESFAPHISIVWIDKRVIGQLRCAETALAVERYRLKYGIVPEMLEELVPEFMEEVPLDPFDGLELGYVLEDPGYRIYIIGDDWEDNGGLSKDEMKELTGQEDPKEFDWPFTVRR